MGRLIDADALTDYVTKVYEYDLCHTDADDYTEGRASAEHYVLEKIRELPTIDAIPVEWMKRIQDKCVADVIQVPMYVAIGWLIDMWQKEQEAHNEQINRR